MLGVRERRGERQWEGRALEWHSGVVTATVGYGGDGGQASRHLVVLLSELRELTSSKIITVMWH